ncbi:MAG: glycosyltransferase, partial [Fidelibacterota bacterium]
MDAKKVSVIIPVYNERESLAPLLDELKQVMESKFEYEIICVDDGSTDGSFEFLKKCAAENRRIHVMRFLRNYGKSAALGAGFKQVNGDYVITMDADLQDDP